MHRAPFQVLVIPYILSNDSLLKYAILKRNSKNNDYWQFVAGGGEDTEDATTAAKRESAEEIGSNHDSNLVKLDSLTMVPVVDVCGFKWGDDTLVIPEYCFGIELDSEILSLSDEHTEYKWLQYEEAYSMVKWDSNRIALWELNHRLTHK